MYTIEKLKEFNPGREYFIDCSTVEKVNNIIKKVSPSSKIKAGDMIKYTDEGGGFFGAAHIDDAGGDSVYICCNASTHVFGYDKIGFSTSGGPWKRIPKNKLNKIGTVSRIFWIWGCMGATADGGIYFEAEVSYWEYNCNKCRYSEEERNKRYFNYVTPKTNSDRYIWKSFPSMIAFEDDISFIKFLSVNKAEIENEENGKFVWVLKEVNKHYNGNEEDYYLLDFPEHAVYQGGEYRKVKIEYKDNKKILHWVHQHVDRCQYYGIKITKEEAEEINKISSEDYKKYSEIVTEFKTVKGDFVKTEKCYSIYIESCDEGTHKRCTITSSDCVKFIMHEYDFSKKKLPLNVVSFGSREVFVSFLKKIEKEIVVFNFDNFFFDLVKETFADSDEDIVDVFLDQETVKKIKG